MCPVTGQPDFATLVIDYVPGAWLVELKSLKLYLNSFRNHGAFHEDCTVAIGKKIIARLKPKWLRIGGYFHPRGGMPIDVFWQAGKLPPGTWVPDQGVSTYRARYLTCRPIGPFTVRRAHRRSRNQTRRLLRQGSVARMMPPIAAISGSTLPRITSADTWPP